MIFAPLFNSNPIHASCSKVSPHAAACKGVHPSYFFFSNLKEKSKEKRIEKCWERYPTLFGLETSAFLSIHKLTQDT